MTCFTRDSWKNKKARGGKGSNEGKNEKKEREREEGEKDAKETSEKSSKVGRAEWRNEGCKSQDEASSNFDVGNVGALFYQRITFFLSL